MFSNLSVRTFRWSVNLHKKGDAAKNLELPKKSVKSKKSTETPEKSKKIVGAKKDQTDKTLKKLKLADLKYELESRGQVTSGVKAVLVERLAGILEKEGHDPHTFVFNDPKIESVPKKKVKAKKTSELSQKQFKPLPLTTKYYFSLYPFKAQDLSAYAHHDPADTKYFEMLSLKVNKAQKVADLEKVKAVVEEIKKESTPIKPQSSQSPLLDIAEAKLKTEMEAKKKAEMEAKKKAEAEAELKAEAEAKKKAEAEAKKKAEAEAKKKAEAEAKLKAEMEAKKKAETEAKSKAEAEAKKKMEEEAKKKAEAEAKMKAEMEAKFKAEAEAKKKTSDSEAVNVEAVPIEQRSGAVRHMNDAKVDESGSIIDALKNWWKKFQSPK